MVSVFNRLMFSQLKIKPAFQFAGLLASVLLILALITPNSSAEAKTVLILGDSLSAGFGISYEKAWPSLLNNSLQDQHQLINASISGETTSGGLKRLPKLLEEHQPNIVIIELGANDGLRGMPLAALKSRLKKLISLAQDADAEVIIAGIQLPPNYGPRYNQAFQQIFIDIANDKKTALIPFLLADVATNRSLMQADGLHPNEQAQAIILKNVNVILDPLLKSE